MNTIDVDILGKNYRLRTDRSEQEIAEIIRMVHAKIDEVKEGMGQESAKDVLVLALLNVVEEYWTLQEEHKKLLAGIDAMQKMIERHL